MESGNEHDSQKLLNALKSIEELSRVERATWLNKWSRLFACLSEPSLVGKGTLQGALYHIVKSKVLGRSPGIKDDTLSKINRIASDAVKSNFEDYQYVSCDCLIQVSDFLSGGLENVVLDQATFFNDKGIKTAILVLGRAGQAVDLAKSKGIPVIVTNYSVEKYREILQKARPNVIFAHYSFNGGDISQGLGVPFVQVVHNLYIWTKDFPELRAPIEENDKFTNHYICVSGQVKAWFTSEFKIAPNRCSVIVNGVDLSNFKLDGSDRDAVRKSFELGKEDILFLNVASINIQKNQLAFVKAAVRVCRNFPKAKFWIVGKCYDDEILSSIQKIIQDAKVEDKIVVKAHADNIKDYYLAADYLVSTSFYEGASLSILESLVMGCPVISTNVGFVTDVPENFLPIKKINSPIPVNELSTLRLKSSDQFVDIVYKAIIEKLNHNLRVSLALNLKSFFSVETTFSAYMKVYALIQDKTKTNLSFDSDWSRELGKENNWSFK